MRPTTRLLWALSGCTLLAFASVESAVWMGPAWTVLAIVVLLGGRDAHRARGEKAPDVHCELPVRARLGEPFAVVYRVRNGTDRGLSLHLLDDRGAAFDGDVALGPCRLDPQGELTLTRDWTPQRRGLCVVGPVHMLVSSRLGLWQRRVTTRTDAVVVRVLPNPGARSMGLVGLDAQDGKRPRRSRGAGMELDSLRPYTEGDDLRHVDWRSTARARQLIVRTFREERNHSIVVAVDAGRMMGAMIDGVSKLDHALNTTVALAQASLVHGDRVGFAAFDAEVRSWLPVSHARRGMARLLEATLPLEVRSVESSFRVLTELLDKNQRKRALIVILTDFVETADALELEGYLGRLARRHVVLLVALRDPALSELMEPCPDLDESALYRRLVLQDLSAERDLVLRRLTRLGVHTLDVRPEHSRAPVLARYLELWRAL